jgi:hypothetical protein
VSVCSGSGSLVFSSAKTGSLSSNETDSCFLASLSLFTSPRVLKTNKSELLLLKSFPIKEDKFSMLIVYSTPWLSLLEGVNIMEFFGNRPGS